MEYYLVLERNELLNSKRRGGALNAYYLAKIPNVKRLHSVWFQLWDILEKTTPQRQLKDQWLPGVWGREDGKQEGTGEQEKGGREGRREGGRGEHRGTLGQ